MEIHTFFVEFVCSKDSFCNFSFNFFSFKINLSFLTIVCLLQKGYEMKCY